MLKEKTSLEQTGSSATCSCMALSFNTWRHQKTFQIVFREMKSNAKEILTKKCDKNKIFSMAILNTNFIARINNTSLIAQLVIF